MLAMEGESGSEDVLEESAVDRVFRSLGREFSAAESLPVRVLESRDPERGSQVTRAPRVARATDHADTRVSAGEEAGDMDDSLRDSSGEAVELVMMAADGGQEGGNNDRWGPAGSFGGVVAAGFFGIGKVLTYPGRLIPGTAEFWRVRDDALQQLYDRSNIGGTGWQTTSEVGSEGAAIALTAGVLGPSSSGSKSVLTQGEKSVAELAGRLKFTETAGRHMAEAGRYVPRHTLSEAIQTGARMPDPQGASGAVKIVTEIWVNNKKRILEIVYRESDDTILHFLYK